MNQIGQMPQSGEGLGKRKQGDQDRGVHDMLPKAILSSQQAKNEKKNTEDTGDQRGFVRRTGENKTSNAENQVRKSKNKGGGSH
jgi:hypothetical protein